MRINIYTALNGVGLQRDYDILRNLFESAGHSVDYSDWKHRKGFDGHRPSRTDVAFHLEIPQFDHISLAPVNIMIPNPEWFETAWLSKLHLFNAVYAKTHDTERIFSQHHGKVVYTSFTSLDKYNPEITKDKVFCHIAGKSSFKGTSELIQAYKHDLPICYMTTQQQQRTGGNLVATGYLTETDLDVLVNACLIHICPSYYEGFGHYIWEAMSCGAVVITTDAPPMNEIGLKFTVRTENGGRHHQGVLNRPNVGSLIEVIKTVESMGYDELISIGQNNRKKYLDNDAFFKERILSLL